MAGALRHDLTIQTRPISELTPWAKNPRDNDAAAEELAYTISEVGWTNPILLDKHGTIIAGHTRLKAALKLGLTEVPTITLDVDGPQAELIAIADNRLSEFAEWDKDALAEILESLQAEGIDTKIAGYGDDDLSDLLASLDSEPIGPDDIEPEAPPEDPDSKRGEVYELGPHRLICGDSTDESVWALVMGKTKADLVLTDPPYGLGDTESEKNNYRTHDDTKENLINIVANVIPIARARARVVALTPGNGNTALYPPPTWTMAWFTPAGVGRGPWGFCCWQPILCYGKDPKLAKGLGCHPDAIVHTESAEDFGHPCSKPINFWVWLVERTSEKGDAIVDPFGGSGTTLIACARTGRTATLIELDPGYCDVIRKRWTAWAKEAGQDPGPGALD